MFAQANIQATAVAAGGFLVTFGIEPIYPATNSGQTKQGEPLTKSAYRVARFVEKPNRQSPQAYPQAGRCYWNVGLFCFDAWVYLKALHQLHPQTYEAVLVCWQGSKRGEAAYLDAALFMQVPSESADNAVLE